MNILLTGSGGFIGSHLKDYLSTNYILYTPRSIELDLTNLKKIEQFFTNHQIDLIIHCATQGARITSEATMEDVAQSNISMFRNLLNYTKTECRMIILGSGAEYNKLQSLKKVKEEDFGISIPQDPYGYSKYIISKDQEGNSNVLNLRLFGVYGANESPTRFISHTIRQILMGQSIFIRRNVVFDYLYIDDFCRIVEKFILCWPSQITYNVTPTQSIDLVSLANLVNEIASNPKQIFVEQKGFNPEYTGDNTRLMKELHDFNFTPYIKGVMALYRYIETQQKNNG